MRRSLRSMTVAASTLVILFVTSATWAQGVTGSAVTGSVGGEGMGALAGTQIQLKNTATGDVFTAVSGPDGKYFIDNVPPGGPYTLTATFEGFAPTKQSGLQLALGQRLNNDVTMRMAVEEGVIIERDDPPKETGRTGAQTKVGDSAIARLPLQGRNFTDLLSTAPQVSGNSISGQNNRYNNIQIDGGANNDLFGLSASGTPGGQSNAKPI